MKALGFQTTGPHTLENEEIVRASVGLDSTLIVLSLMKDDTTLQPHEDLLKYKPGAGIEFCINVNESKPLDELFSQVKANRIPVINEAVPAFWSDRMFTITDPDGYVLSFGKHIETAAPNGLC